MSFISVFDVLGPNMIGPSSSHTAGAAVIAYLAHKMIAPPLKKADFTLYGSFAKTYHGHGTDRALLGGIMGFSTDDTRIRDWHEKVYRCNEQKNESLDLAGDYCKTGGVQVDITGTENAAWAIKGKVAERSNGQCIIGLTPGKYTIEFTAVDGKTKPADQEVTVVEGEVTTATGAYT